MNSLNEHTIKKVGLGFLKKYYRYHPREGDSEMEIDMRGDGGIIVDAYFKLKQKDGSEFIATLEATSANTRDEVKYSVQRKLLIWDGITLALFGTSGLFLSTLVFKWYLIKNWGTWPTVAVLGACCVVLYFVYQIAFSSLRRYRYIYAIEQFKRYYATEQWLALGEDVFSDFENKYYKELKKQCIYNGIGLLVIDHNHQYKVTMTPSRDDLFENKRKTVQLVALDQFTSNLPKKLNIGVENVKFDLSWLKSGDRYSLKRYQKTFYRQIIFSLLSILAIGGVFYKQLQEKPIEYVDELEYEEEHKPTPTTTEREPLSYKVDSQFVAPYLEKVPQYTGLEEDTVDFVKVAVRKKKTKTSTKKTSSNPEILISVGANEEWLEYDCTRFYTFTTTKYCIEESRHNHLDMAAERLEELERLGYEASTMWMGCFFSSQSYYAVVLGPLLSSRNDAERELAYYNRQMNLENQTNTLNIVAIPPKKKK